MESTVEVALAAKILKLFPPREDKYLSFPMTGLAFTHDDLDFLSDDEGLSASQLREKMKRKAQFARLTNRIPDDSLVYSTTDGLLWLEYARILEGADLAESLLTADEAESLQQADAFLTDEKVVDGIATKVYSPAVKAYYEYKDAYQEIERIYLDEESTALSSDDPDEKRVWETVRKPQLADLESRALSDWHLLGHKDEVEKHQLVKMRLSGKLPRRYVTDYLNDLEACKEPDLLTNDPIGTFSTFYSPSDMFDPASDWPRINLTKSEVSALVRGAPPELRRFASQSADDIESLAIEYATIALIRPWLSSGFFSSRYWRLPQGEVVSDGAIPRSGRIPAFVTDLIVTRKIIVHRLKPTSRPAGRPAATPETFKSLNLMSPAAQNVSQNWKITAGESVTRHRVKPTTVPTTVRPQPARPQPTRVSVRPATVGKVAVRPAVPAVTRAPTPVRRSPVVLAARTPIPASRSAYLRSKVQGTTVNRRVVVVPPRQPSKPPPPPPVEFERVVEEVALDGVAVLAFVCRRVPRCPNPDVGLSWD